MTVDECHTQLTKIRRNQGTDSPLIRVDYGGTAYHGRLTRADCDLDRRAERESPYGVLVLEALGLAPGPETILQIGSIPEDGIAEINER